MIISDIIKHCRNMEYMSGISRDKIRTDVTQEVFTPTLKVIELLDEYPSSDYSNSTKTFLDPSCGDGQFLSEVLIRKLQNDVGFEVALSTIYGVDLMQDNVDLCRERLLCGREDLRHIVERNIVCVDGLRYHYRFDGSHPYDDEIKQKQQDELFNSLFE
jgi:hypothetical protein